MTRLKLILSAAAIAALLNIGTTTVAYAYIDPGSASIIIQGIIGGIAAGGVVLRMYWGRIRLVFGGKTRQTKPNASQEESVSDIDGE